MFILSPASALNFMSKIFAFSLINSFLSKYFSSSFSSGVEKALLSKALIFRSISWFIFFNFFLSCEITIAKDENKISSPAIPAIITKIKSSNIILNLILKS